MAYFEFRKFNFFELTQNVDDGKLSEVLKNVRVVASSCGNGLLVFADSENYIHLVNNNFEITSFRAYASSIHLISMAKFHPVLVTIGEDDMGVNPTLKVWAVDKKDKQGNPVCQRITRTSVPNKPVLPSVLALNDSLNLMAVGFVDGSVLLIRGDVTRDRGSRQKMFWDEPASITGLAFHCPSGDERPRTCHLYVSTLSSVSMYDVSLKDQEKRTRLDTIGCALGCSMLAETLDSNETQFVVATNNAIYFYINGVKGSCQIIDGEKLALAWYRNYLVIVTRPSAIQSVASASSSMSGISADVTLVNVLDLSNKIMAYTGQLDEATVLVEWGSIYALASSGGHYSLSAINETDLQSKLAMLFKKNLYDIAIRMAKAQQYDTVGLMELFCKYGDYLYNKGDYRTAMDQYIKTIGYLDPSYIIRKYRECEKVDMLPLYLEGLHKADLANQDHTTLLLNCYTKLNKPNLLKEFIMEKRGKFDVSVAIEACRHTSIDEALVLAKNHRLHSCYLDMLIHDRNDSKAALEYIASLPFEEAENMMLEYCTVLLQQVPSETTEFLKKLTTGYSPSKQSLDEEQNGGVTLPRSDIKNFLNFFLDKSEELVDLISHIQQSGVNLGSEVASRLLEHHLRVWSITPTDVAADRIIALLDGRNFQCDRLQALVLCKNARFTPGLLRLYEENKMYVSILKHHLSKKDYRNVISTCKRLGGQEPRLWILALNAMAADPQTPASLLNEVLAVIDEKKLMSPLMVVGALCMKRHLGEVRSYLDKIFSREGALYKSQVEETENLNAKIQKLTTTIDDIKLRPVIFQGNKCAACEKKLFLPAVNFLCKHSYHQDCFQGFSEEGECFVCAPNNKGILNAIQAQEKTRGLAEDFHSLLDKTDDSFSLVTKFLARCVFSSSLNTPSANMWPVSMSDKRDTGNQPFESQIEKSQHISAPRVAGKPLILEERPVLTSRSIAAVESFPTPGNPFGDDEDDDEEYDPKNPFSQGNADDDDDDDYDSRLNPFG